MKFKKFTIFLLALFFAGAASAQTDSDTTTKKPEIKKGWNFGVLPTITYNSDLGFQYGALVDLYNYGDGKLYPKYYERLYVEWSRFTKGSGINNLSFESNRLLKGRTIFFDVMYNPDDQYDFIGMNGYEAMYNLNWIDPSTQDYKTRMFYKNQTKLFRIKLDVLNPINKKFSWTAGIIFYNIGVDTVDIAKFNKGKKDADKLPNNTSQPGLYQRYVNWGLIPEAQKNGGSFMGFKAGLVYDTRDNWTSANKGIWTEFVLMYVPPFIGTANANYMKFSLIHRQYFTIVKHKLTFAYRIGYQGILFGEEPFYAQPYMINVTIKNSMSTGLGGKKTIRGVKRNRVVGNGKAWLNAEFRWRFVNFDLFRQHFYLATNLFMDAGMIVQKTPIEERYDDIVAQHPLTDANFWGADYKQSDYFNFGGEKPHVSYGLGLRIGMNENFVVSVDYGRTFNSQDGLSGFYIGLGYLF